MHACMPYNAKPCNTHLNALKYKPMTVRVYAIRAPKLAKVLCIGLNLQFLSKRCIEFHGSQQHHAHTAQTSSSSSSDGSDDYRRAHGWHKTRTLAHSLIRPLWHQQHTIPHVRLSICFGYHRVCCECLCVSASARRCVCLCVLFTSSFHRFDDSFRCFISTWTVASDWYAVSLCVPLCEYNDVRRTLFSTRLNFQIFSFQMVPGLIPLAFKIRK